MEIQGHCQWCKVSHWASRSVNFQIWWEYLWVWKPIFMQSCHRLLTKTPKPGTYLSMTLPTVWRGWWAHACQLETGLGGGFLRGEWREKCLVLNTDVFTVHLKRIIAPVQKGTTSCNTKARKNHHGRQKYLIQALSCKKAMVQLPP